jgi:hypothetical protein
MTAGRYDLTIEQGSTFEKQLTVLKNNLPWDFTNYIGRAQIRKTYESADILQTITVNISDPTNGIIDLLISATDTAALQVTNAVWDLEVDDQAGTPVVKKLLKGKVEIVPEVTR